MNYQELTTILEEKLQRHVFGAALAEAVQTSRQNMSKKLNNPNVEVSVSDLRKVERAFNVVIYRTEGYSGERQNDTSLGERLKGFGVRLSEIQEKHNFLDREMATLLKISEKEYIQLVLGKKLPTLEILSAIKQNFKVFIDELLWG